MEHISSDTNVGLTLFALNAIITLYFRKENLL
ncbi:hypothetical protein SDC9_117754 [bioreactor metagenome]|uniref:Uncharacterized protein n=1 Tax=bioreactor metagenome TaxID=1076179 RepID=A0A645C8J4_9ZZZZ